MHRARGHLSPSPPRRRIAIDASPAPRTRKPTRRSAGRQIWEAARRSKKVLREKQSAAEACLLPPYGPTPLALSLSLSSSPPPSPKTIPDSRLASRLLPSPTPTPREPRRAGRPVAEVQLLLQTKAMVESNGQRIAAPATAGLFRIPGLFVRLSSKNIAVDPDSVWSPTSPLDFKNLRSSPPRVGLGLVDALTADESGALHVGGRSSFLDSIRPFLELTLPKGKKAASSAGVATTLDEVNDYDADSEEYTCVIARGANPRTTHILAGETVEVREGAVGGACRKVIFSIEPFGDQQPSTSSSPAAPGSLASGRCCCCMKRLPEGRDIFMYLGEKAFCSNECRKGYIEEEIEEAEELMILDSGLNL